jgi:6-phosphogluconolactonase
MAQANTHRNHALRVYRQRNSQGGTSMKGEATSWFRSAISTAAVVILCQVGSSAASANEDRERDDREHSRGGAVYTLTNEARVNAVVAFNRSAGGTLSDPRRFPTGGRGTGSGLGSQGAVALSRNGRWLFAVNAGSNDISVFSVQGTELRLAHRSASGGTMPISITSHRNLVFVLNAGGDGNIAGFSVSGLGALRPLPDAARSLSGPDTGPAQISFSPDGESLVVTEKNTGLLDLFSVDEDGAVSKATQVPSNGETPFGFSFTRRGLLVVSEAFGGRDGESAVSSYQLEDVIQPISGSVPDHQTAACWIAITHNGRFAYTTNTGSGTISGYRVSSSGALSLLNADGVTASTGDGSSPTDMALSADSSFLYALGSGTGTISAFHVEGDGSLTPVDQVGGLPTSVIGLEAR